MQRQQRYGWLRTKRVFEVLRIFAFSNDEDLRVDAKIEFNISVTSENLLSEEKIDSSIRDAVNLTHLERVELYFYAANILSKTKGLSKDCCIGEKNVIKFNKQQERKAKMEQGLKERQVLYHQCSIRTWLYDPSEIKILNRMEHFGSWKENCFIH